MAEVTVTIDIDDHLDEASEHSLRAELARREKKRAPPGAPAPRLVRPRFPSLADPHPWTTPGLAEDLRSAFYRRDASRFEALLAIAERRAAQAA